MSINTLSTSFELRVSPSPFQGGFSWKPEKEMVPWWPLYYTPSCLSHQPALLQPQGGSSGSFRIGWEKGAQSWMRKGRWKLAKILLNCGCYILAFMLSGLVTVQSYSFPLLWSFYGFHRDFSILPVMWTSGLLVWLLIVSPSGPGHQAVHRLYWGPIAPDWHTEWIQNLALGKHAPLTYHCCRCFPVMPWPLC